MNLTDEMKWLFDLNIQLTTETDYKKLLKKILTASMDAVPCEAGVLSMGKSDCCVRELFLTGKSVETERGLFLRTERFIPDTVLSVPIGVEGREQIGEIRLMNAISPDNSPKNGFDENDKTMVYFIASQAAVSLQHIKDLQGIKDLMYSMVSAFTKAIDERTPYNASHTMQVARYTEGFLDFLNRHYEDKEEDKLFDANEREQIILAANLHDIGKLVIPLNIMNKANRLGKDGLGQMKDRFRLIRAYLQVDFLEGRLREEEYIRQYQDMKELLLRIEQADKAILLRKAEISYFSKMGERVYTKADGTNLPWITEGELANLQIQKGTLTEKERKIMEYHSEVTSKILQKIKFGENYSQVRFLAGAHHEFLDGTGYPAHLKGNEIPRGVRILTICDIYDSLVATDRPYKKPMTSAKARATLRGMVTEGKLDPELTELFCEYTRKMNYR